MAEEEVQQNNNSGGGNNNKLLIILIVLVTILILTIAGGVAYYILTQQNNNSKDSQTQEKAKDFEVSGKLYKASIDDQVLNIMTTRGKSKLMKLSFTIKSTAENIQQIVDDNKEEIVDEVIRLVTARSAEELQTVGGKELLKEELIQVINTILNQNAPEGYPVDSVKKIFFTSFVIK